jgi:regulator of RNase E activity RraA
LFYEAIAGDPVAKVVVMHSSGHGETSVGGGTKLSRLQNHGLAGLITDGRLRDFRELAGYEPVFYCRGKTKDAGPDNQPFGGAWDDGMVACWSANPLAVLWPETGVAS